MAKEIVTFEAFLRTLESPQFKKNAEKIHEFLEQSEEEARAFAKLIDAHKGMFLTCFHAYEELRCLKELRSTGKFVGSDYQLLDKDLIVQIADQVETAYLNHLLSIEKTYSRFTKDPRKYEEARRDNSGEWLKDEMADELPFGEFIDYYYKKNDLVLGKPNRIARTLIDWKEKVAMQLPFSDAVVLQGRPITVEHIEQQIQQVNTAMLNGRDLLLSAEDDLIDDFIRTLLNARVKLDNKLFRDVYYTLDLYGRLPKEVVETHNNNEDTNKYIRETYIRQKFYRLIDQDPELKLWYKRLHTELKKKS